MMMTAEIKTPYRFHPHKFALWLGIAAIIMLFAALTSAYLVQQAKRSWIAAPLPSLFWINTLVILASSASMHFAVRAFRKLRAKEYKLALFVTLLLGLLFLVLQYIGWKQLPPLGENDWSNYVQVISGVHAAHIAGGLLIMLGLMGIALFRPFNPNRLVANQIMATYWHFVDILWIYLFVFFQINLG